MSSKLPEVTNLFAGSLAKVTAEQIVPLLSGARFRLEHIVSNGQPTPPGQWYDQPEPEWVVLIRGNAQLIFELGGRLDLVAGDACLIEAHQRHRVEACSRDAGWVALHFAPPAA